MSYRVVQDGSIADNRHKEKIHTSIMNRGEHNKDRIVSLCMLIEAIH